MDTKLKDLIINEVTEEKLKELEDNNEIPPNELFVTEDEDEALIIDEALDANSENPVANKPVAEKFNEIEPSVQFAESERQKSKNLFNVTKAEPQGYSWQGVPTAFPNDSYISCGFIKIKPNTNYIFSLADSSINIRYTGALFYTADKTYIGYDECNKYTFKTPSNAEYMICQFWFESDPMSYKDIIQIEEGNSATEFQPYNGPIMHKDDSPVKFAEKHYLESVNLFDIKDAVVNPNVTTYGYIPIKNIKDKYVISLQNGKASYVEGLAFGICKDPSSPTSMTNGGYTWMVETSYLRHTKVEANITDRPYIVFYPNSYETLKKLVDNFDVQINEGTQKTDYQPFKGKVIHEEDLAESLYDKNSLDPDINLGLPAGIMFSGTTINATLIKSKEKFRHIRYTVAFDENRKMCITVKNQHRVQTRAIFASEADWNGTYICMGGIVLQPDGGIFGWCKSVSLSSEFARLDYNNNSKFYIEKIEGVY